MNTRLLNELDRSPIVLGADHAGYALKEYIKNALQRWEIPVKDVGAFTNDQPSDYPIYAGRVASAVSRGVFSRGIHICGNGMGTVITANRYPEVRALICTSPAQAKLAREHNNANILVLAGRLTQDWEAAQILETFLLTEFEGGRHARRVSMIDESTKLTIAFSHLWDVDPKKLESDRVDPHLIEKAERGFESIRRALTQGDRRTPESRVTTQKIPITVNYEGDSFPADLLNISERGAKIRLPLTGEPLLLIEGDKLSFQLLIDDEMVVLFGDVKWIDLPEQLLGVEFSKEVPQFCEKLDRIFEHYSK